LLRSKFGINSFPYDEDNQQPVKQSEA